MGKCSNLMNRFPDVLKPPTRLGLIQSGQLSSRPKHPPVGASSNPGIPQRPSIQLQEVPFSINILNKAAKYISWLNGTRSIKKWVVICGMGLGWLTATFSSSTPWPSLLAMVPFVPLNQVKVESTPRKTNIVALQK